MDIFTFRHTLAFSSLFLGRESGKHPGEMTITVGVDWAGCLMLLLSCIILILSVRKLTRFAPGEEEGIHE